MITNSINTRSKDYETDVTKTDPLLHENADDITNVQPLQPVESIDLAAVQPLPLGPVFASEGEGNPALTLQSDPFTSNEENGDLTAVHPLPLEPVKVTVDDADTDMPTLDRPFATDANGIDSVGSGATALSSVNTAGFALAATSTSSTDSSLHGGVFTDYVWDNSLSKAEILHKSDGDNKVYVTDYVPSDMISGPTLTENGGDGDFTALAYGELLKEVTGTAAFGSKRAVDIISDGLYVTDATDTQFIGNDDGVSVKYYKESDDHRWHSNYHLYDAVDASNATQYFTYEGITKENYVDQVYTTKVNTTYHVNNYFKGGDYGNSITGGTYGDVLIGGAQDDTISGVSGNNLIYGVGGNNSLFGGTGNDIIFGGTGDDFINTGKGNNTVVLQSGDNIVIAPQNSIEDGDTTTYTNSIVAGTGSDTFIIGNIPAAVTTVNGFGYNGVDILESAGESVGESILKAGLEAVAMNPIVGFMADGITSMFSSLMGGTPADVVETTEWGDFYTTNIYNYDPTSDRLLLPMNPNGDYNLSFSASESAADDYSFKVIDETGGSSVILEVSYGSGKDIFGDWHTDELTLDEKKGFNESLMANAFTLDGDHIFYAGHSVGSTTLENLTGLSLSDELGTARYGMAGAWSGYFIQGGIDSKYIMGTDNSDVLFGYDVTNDLDPTGDSKTYYGFEGDNLFGGAFADNTIIGGSGNNTITYQYFSSEKIGDSSGDDVYIEADMSTTYESTTYNDAFGEYFQIETHGAGTQHIDKVFNVQTIVGSQGDDILIGNDEDNTFYSTGGDNTWTGGDGADTFYVNGGSVTITDFVVDQDTIVVQKLAYVEGSVNYAENLKWVETDDSWLLFDLKNLDTDDPSALITLEKGDGFDGAVDIDIERPNGDIYTISAETSTFDSLGIDFIA